MAYSAAHTVSGQQVQGAGYEEQSNNALSGFTFDQVQRLRRLIEPLQPGYDQLAGQSLWIRDSGASRHMTGDVQVIERKTSVAPIPVSLPNGASTVANMEGSIHFSPQIDLDKVIYIQNGSCN